MLFAALLRHLTGQARLEEVAEQAAARTRHIVWQRVERQVVSMEPAETRGYVRARSALVVHREVDRMLRHDASLRPAARARLIELITTAMLRIIADQVVFVQSQPNVPAIPVVLRKAA